MSEISRKDALARNMMKISKVLPHEFNFSPHTWLLPNDYMHLCAFAADAKRNHQKKTFILKPSNGMLITVLSSDFNGRKMPNGNFVWACLLKRDNTAHLILDFN